ncbi:MAG TPA: alpha/beta hydrolase [Steroidobacteraceae bacterium]|jgi:pimeloyl-ACP methyl ester carboxylesterase
MNAVTHHERTLSLWSKQIKPRVLFGGGGPPVIFLHGAGGLLWDDFLDALATNYTVYAPEFPGTSPGEYDAIKVLDDWHDLVVYYSELIDELGVKDATLIGHSFGGMIAAEIAAANPRSIAKLVLLSPLGLWRDDTPIPPWLSMNAEEMSEVFFYDKEIAKRFMLTPDVAATQPDLVLSATWALACAGKFTWPIPDRGLRDRLHRISMPTLLVWGDKDKLVPPIYATDFQAGIANSRLSLVPDAGHAFIHEKHREATKAVSDFIGA